MKSLIATWCLVSALGANAQAVTPMEFTLGATMLAPKGVVTSCGIEFAGVAARSGPELEADQVAGSVALHADVASMVKAGHQIAYRKADGIAVRPAADKISWIRVEGGTSLTPENGLLVPGERPPFHLFGVAAEPAMKAMTAMLQGKTIWVGFAEDGVTKSIFSGRVKPEGKTSELLDACLREFLAISTPRKQSDRR